jgi:hypothetical protein
MPTPTILGAPINSRLGLPHMSGQSAVLSTENALRTFGGGNPPIFSRASTAYRADGSQVATGVPRLERGRWHNAIPAVAATLGVDSNSNGQADGWVFYNAHSEMTGKATRSVVPCTFGVTGYGQRLLIPTLSGLTATRDSGANILTTVSASAGEVWTIAIDVDVAQVTGCNFRAHIVASNSAGEWLGQDGPTIASVTGGKLQVSKSHTLPANTASIFVNLAVENLHNGDSADVTFANCVLIRDSAAPRFFIPGGYGERGAVMAEEGTTNVEPNPSVETDLVGWGSWYGVGGPNRDTTVKRRGSASARMDGIDGSNGAIQLSAIPVTSGGTYTTSAYFNSPTGKGCRLYFESLDSGGASLGVFGPGIQSSNEPWKRQVHTYTLPANAASLKRFVYAYGLQAGESIWVDDVQTEAKPYATSFTDSARAAESLTLDVRGLLRPEEGAILLNAYEDGQASGQHYLFDTDGADRLRIYRNGANWVAEAGGVSFNFAKPAVGWHAVAFWWEGRAFGVTVDAVAKGAGVLTKPLTDVGRAAYFGSDKALANQWNAPIQRVPLATRRWSDAEIRNWTAYSPLLGVA